MYSKSNKSKEKKNKGTKKTSFGASKYRENAETKYSRSSKSFKGKRSVKSTKNVKAKRKKVVLGLKKLLRNSFLSAWAGMKDYYFSYDVSTAKVFSTTCNLMTLSIVLLCTLFVYLEESLFYAFPLITVLAIFVKFGRGNRHSDSSERDLVLYKKILLVNLFLVLGVFVEFQEDLWFVNFFMILIFVVPLFIARCFEYFEY